MILVSGATGNVGAGVVHELRARDLAVRAFVRDRGKAERLLGPDVALAPGDLAEPSAIRAALDGVDQVFLACANHPRQVEYETNLVEAALAAGVERIVKLSATVAEIGSPLAFGDAQGRIEAHLRASGLPAVVLRPGYYMTSLLAAADGVRHAGKLFAPAEGAKVAMIDPRDVAAVAATVLAEPGHDGETYVLSGPEAITFDQVAETLSEVTGRPVEFVAVPDEAARQGLLDAGVPEWFADNVIVVFGLLRQGVAAATTDTVRELTGREPRSFAAFAADHAAAWSGALAGDGRPGVSRAGPQDEGATSGPVRTLHDRRGSEMSKPAEQT